MVGRKICLREDKEALAFLLGVWSADGYVGIYPKYRIYRFGIIMSANEQDLVRVYQDIAGRLGFQFKPPRYLNKRRTGIALEINSKIVVGMLLKAGAVPRKKTETNPSVPQWIKENPEYIKNWFRGEVLGDGSIRPEKCYVEWYRTINISRHSLLWGQLADLVARNPKALRNKLTDSLQLAQGYIPSNIDVQIRSQYTPRMLNDEMNMLIILDIYPNTNYTINCYPKTQRITATWAIYTESTQTIKLAKFLGFSKTPWHATKIQKLKQIEALKI